MRLFLFAGLGLLLLLGLATPTLAQDRLEDDPGYLDMRQVEGWFEVSPRYEVNVKGALLKMVAEASRYEDPELANLLSKLKAIQVRGFALRWSQFDEVVAQVETMVQGLESRGWDTVVRVREEEEHVDMYLKMDGDAIAGLAVFVVEPGDDETVFVNIVGEIDPADLGRLGRRFNFETTYDRDW